MQLLLNDDPAFKPPVLKSSLGTQEDNNNNSGNQDDDEEEEDVVDPKSTHTAPPAKKRNRFDELKNSFLKRGITDVYKLWKACRTHKTNL